MKVKVDRGLCVGLGNCAAIAPMVFRLDDESKAVVLDHRYADEELLMEAARGCLMKAVIVLDDEGNQRYP